MSVLPSTLCGASAAAAPVVRARALHAVPDTAALPRVVGAGLTVPTLAGPTAYANLDHAASTPALETVTQAVDRTLETYASVHRGAGYASRLTSAAVHRGIGLQRAVDRLRDGLEGGRRRSVVEVGVGDGPCEGRHGEPRAHDPREGRSVGDGVERAGAHDGGRGHRGAAEGAGKDRHVTAPGSGTHRMQARACRTSTRWTRVRPGRHPEHPTAEEGCWPASRGLSLALMTCAER